MKAPENSTTTIFLGLLAVLADTAAIALDPMSNHTKRQVAAETFEGLRDVSQQLMAGSCTPLEALDGFGAATASVSSKWADKMDAGTLTPEEIKDCGQFFVSGLGILAEISAHVALRQLLEAGQAKVQQAAANN